MRPAHQHRLFLARRPRGRPSRFTGVEVLRSYFKRGMAYQTRGDLSRAIADYSKTLEILTSFAEGYAKRGYAFATQDDSDKALSDWTAALELNPKLTCVYYNRGNLRLSQGDFD